MSCQEDPQMGRDPVPVGEVICGAVAREACREAARAEKNGSTTDETTVDLSVRAPLYPGVDKRVGKSSPGEHRRQMYPVLAGCVCIPERVV